MVVQSCIINKTLFEFQAGDLVIRQIKAVMLMTVLHTKKIEGQVCRLCENKGCLFVLWGDETAALEQEISSSNRNAFVYEAVMEIEVWGRQSGREWEEFTFE